VHQAAPRPRGTPRRTSCASLATPHSACLHESGESSSSAPALISGQLNRAWIYLTAPTLGAIIAVGTAYILRSPCGGPDGTRTARGILPPPPHHPFGD
jgi:hypothetical protein